MPVYIWPGKSKATRIVSLHLTWQTYGNKKYQSASDHANLWQQEMPSYTWSGKSTSPKNANLHLTYQFKSDITDQSNKKRQSQTYLANRWPLRGSPMKPAAEGCWSPPNGWRWRLDHAARGLWGQLVLWGLSVYCGWSGSETVKFYIFLIHLLVREIMRSMRMT